MDQQATAIEPQAPTIDSPATEHLLDLAAPERVVCIRHGKQVARHYFRPPTLSDWQKYLAAKNPARTFEDKGVEQRMDEPDCALWRELILRIEGYKGGDELEPEEWKARIPVSHKAAAIEGLQEIYIGDYADPTELAAASRRVVLDVSFNERIFDQLVHVFRVPTIENELDYRRVKVNWQRVRGARSQKVQVFVPPRLREMCSLWDRLVLEVEGYKVGADFKRAMDCLHKQAAVMGLFDRPEEGGAEG